MAKSSPFSFHCVICFDEFNAETRYPVVLPCGHTYVCSECAVRIDRCMECRTSLLHSLPQPIAQNATNTATASVLRSASLHGFRRAGDSDRIRQCPPPQERLPLPKNVVLISLMESTEIASPPLKLMKDDESELDENETGQYIHFGTSLATGTCGTYVVAEKMD